MSPPARTAPRRARRGACGATRARPSRPPQTRALWPTTQARSAAVAPLHIRPPHISATAQRARWAYVGGALALEALLIAGAAAHDALLTVPALIWPMAAIAAYRICAQPRARGPLWRPRYRGAPNSDEDARPALELARGVLSLADARIDMSAPFGVQLNPNAATSPSCAAELGLTLTQGAQRLAVRAAGVAVDVSEALEPLDSRAPMLTPDDLRALWEHVRAWSALHGAPPAWALCHAPDDAPPQTAPARAAQSARRVMSR